MSGRARGKNAAQAGNGPPYKEIRAHYTPGNIPQQGSGCPVGHPEYRPDSLRNESGPLRKPLKLKALAFPDKYRRSGNSPVYSA